MGGINISDIHLVNPYEGFDHKKYPLDVQGWNGEEPLFKHFIGELKPSLIIEVGTWKGQSALFMADYVRSMGFQTKILCVDTWLGSIEHLTFPEMLMPVNGYPTIYYQFIANVKHASFENVIIPFPQTSTEAARWLKQKGIIAQLIYLDASHTEDDLYSDMNNYWELLSEGGIMVGDDLSDSYPGVRAAVERFCAERGVSFTGENKWVIRK